MAQLDLFGKGAQSAPPAPSSAESTAAQRQPQKKGGPACAGASKPADARKAQAGGDRAPSPERFTYAPGLELELVRRVRARLASPARWCQRVTARDAAGLPVEPRSRAAVRWDIAGAFVVERGDGGSIPLRLNVVFDRLLEGAPPTKWQDHRTHAEVLALLDALLAELESRGSPC